MVEDEVLNVPPERLVETVVRPVTRKVVDALEMAGRKDHLELAQVQRAWGTYETEDRGPRLQTKRIVVKPEGKLSLQLHRHRSKHWIVVSGNARATVGDEVRLLQEDQATFIPAGTIHRLEKPGNILLHIIEVQCGAYLRRRYRQDRRHVRKGGLMPPSRHPFIGQIVRHLRGGGVAG